MGIWKKKGVIKCGEDFFHVTTVNSDPNDIARYIGLLEHKIVQLVLNDGLKEPIRRFEHLQCEKKQKVLEENRVHLEGQLSSIDPSDTERRSRIQNEIVLLDALIKTHKEDGQRLYRVIKEARENVKDE